VGDVHREAIAQLRQRFDATHGGFGAAPKFPQAPLLQYLLSLAALGNEGARGMLIPTLQHMAAGGMVDHVGGGFARYSTDERWHVPHFEKMLYDNAQLARVYVGAYRLTEDARLRFVAEDALAWMQREMHPADAPAAYSSAQDADSEGEEGKFYVWTLGDFRAVLGRDAEIAARLYGVTQAGNWEHGNNVLERRDPEGLRAELGFDLAAFDAWERSVRERLNAARERRIRPITDDKVLADWNGMALRALAEAGRLLGRPGLIESARALAHFVLDTMMRDGRLCHAWRAGALRSESFLADHAQIGLGLVELHAATGEMHWIRAAHRLADQIVERFHDADEGFFDSEPGVLPLRARDLFDGAVPSGTAAACELLLRLSGIFERGDLADIALQTLERQSGLLAHPEAAPALLHAHLLAEHGAELALPVEPGGKELVATAQAEFAPRVTFAIGPPGALPVLVGRRSGQAYLCRRGACQLPAKGIEQLRDQLGNLHRL
jgi:hypothetical protein